MKTRSDIGYFLQGESALLVKLGNGFTLELNLRVHQLSSLIRGLSLPGIQEIIPSYNSLLICFDPFVISKERLINEINILAEISFIEPREGRVIKIPVSYGGRYGQDIEFVASYNKISTEEVIRIHTGPDYVVCMLGFLPGFPYLGGLSERLFTPRLEMPRLHVAAGSVGIADMQTGIYPIDSPGGWRVIGRTSLSLFDATRKESFLLSPGDTVRFYAV